MTLTAWSVTRLGGAFGEGTLFELSPSGSKTILQDFSYPGYTQGNQPSGPLTLGSGGVVFGTTYYGGAYGKGIVYKFSP